MAKTPAKKPYRSMKRRELDAIEARRLAARITIDELARKADITERTYRNAQRSGMAFKRTLVALNFALRTLEGDRRREIDVFPFEPPAPSPPAAGGASGSRSSTSSPASGLPVSAKPSEGRT